MSQPEHARTTHPHAVLFEPLTINGCELANRVVMLPHVTMYAELGRPTARLCEYLVERARGGVGLVVTGSQSVHATSGHRNCVNASDPEAVAGWRPAIDGCHEAGARIFAQLSHFGAETFTVFTRREQWAPSAVPEPAVGEIPKAMTLDDIGELVETFAAAAANVVAVGFDGVELKIGHDGLLRRFLSPASNQRTDRYGGSEADRLRLPLEVIAAVRAAVGPAVPLGVRLCLDEGIPGGYGLDDALRFARAFVEAGIDYLSADQGTWSRIDLQVPPMTEPATPARDAVAALKRAVDVPVIAFARIQDPDEAAAILREGDADLIGMARQLLVDPAWVTKVRDGRAEEIRPCVACNQECVGRIAADQPIGCVHNPAAGHEATLGLRLLRPTVTRRKVVVVGGGPAGLKTAEIAAQRGHDVVLFEGTSALGGQVRLAARAPHHAEWGRIVEHLAGQIDRLGVDVRLGEEATAEDVIELEPDRVVVASGARPAPPPFRIRGDVPVSTAWDLLAVRNAPPEDEDVLLLDLGVRFEGAALAETLLARGNRVRWVAPGPFVGHTIDPGNLVLLRRRIAEQPVDLEPTSMVLEVDDEGVLLLDVFSQQVRRTPAVDRIVVAGNKRSISSLADALGTRVPSVVLVGDAIAPRNVTMATHDGARAGFAV